MHDRTIAARRPSGRVRRRDHLDHRDLCDALGGEHPQHVAWLRAKFPDRAEADLADVVQDALTEFWRKGGASEFATLDTARAYLRAVMRNRSIDRVRAEKGRRPGERERRPQSVSLDDPSIVAVAGQEALGALHERAGRDHATAVVGEAIATLKPDYARVLRRRFADDLDPASIATLESISLKQYEDRLTRAVKALGRALAGVAIDPGCERARGALRSRRVELMPFEADHVACCPACRAFRLTLRGSLALVPAPMFSRMLLASMRESGAGAAGSAGTAEPSGALGQLKALLAKPVAILATTAGVGAGAAGLTAAAADDERRAAAAPARPVAARVMAPSAARRGIDVERSSRRFASR